MDKKEDIKQKKFETKPEKSEQKSEQKAEIKAEVEKEKLLSISEISLWLDTYDDIFSDFDPRPYSERALSVDFLDEVKRASRERASGILELKLLIPKDMQNSEKESQIKKRLHEHFKKHHGILKKEKKKILKRSIITCFIGLAMMTFASLLRALNPTLFNSILMVLFEPAGWFAVWFSLDRIFYLLKGKQQDLEFYEKMSKSEISFISY